MTPKNLDALAELLKSREGAGLFVSFEGGDGCGKSTQIGLLSEALKLRGVAVLVSREPGGTPLGQQLRHHIQHGPDDVDPRTEALLYAADRAYHVSTLLRPALARGATILEDRYIDSSVAYQGAARDLGSQEIRALSEWATEGLTPDVTLLFDIDADEGLARAGASGESLDRLERAGSKFHARVRKEYLRIAAQYPQRFVTIDAAAPIEEVFEDVVDSLLERLTP